MSWLDERLITHVYKKPDGSEIYLECPAGEEPPAEFQGGAYDGFLPEKMNWTVKTSFEVNGRVGYRYHTGDGKPRIASATREKYERTGDTKSVYTKRFQKFLDRNKKKGSP